MFSVASSMLELDTGQITNIWQNESVIQRIILALSYNSKFLSTS